MGFSFDSKAWLVAFVLFFSSPIFAQEARLFDLSTGPGGAKVAGLRLALTETAEGWTFKLTSKCREMWGSLRRPGRSSTVTLAIQDTTDRCAGGPESFATLKVFLAFRSISEMELAEGRILLTSASGLRIAGTESAGARESTVTRFSR